MKYSGSGNLNIFQREIRISDRFHFNSAPAGKIG